MGGDVPSSLDIPPIKSSSYKCTSRVIITPSTATISRIRRKHQAPSGRKSVQRQVAEVASRQAPGSGCLGCPRPGGRRAIPPGQWAATRRGRRARPTETGSMGKSARRGADDGCCLAGQGSRHRWPEVLSTSAQF